MSGAKGSMQQITIEPAVNGWIVRVGCAPFVAVDKDLMLNGISRYIDQPRAVLAERLRSEVNEGAYSPDSTTREALGQPEPARSGPTDESDTTAAQVEQPTLAPRG